MPQSIDCGDLVDIFISSVAISNIKVRRVEAATSSHSDESTVEIDNHAGTTVLG